MKKGFLALTWIGFIWYIGLVSAVAQQLSTNQVNYQLTYNTNTQIYTVWVVPKYATPNANNPNNTKPFSLAASIAYTTQDFLTA
jgi:hypothetical protein